MLAWLLGFIITVPTPLAPEGAPIAPTDIAPGSQTVDLRAPLIARTPGARLMLFVRDPEALEGVAGDRNADFARALPPGSVTARLGTADGRTLVLEHTGHTFYRGYAGLVLTERQPGTRNTAYHALEIESDRALPDVRFVWLDQRVRRVQDTDQLR